MTESSITKVRNSRAHLEQVSLDERLKLQDKIAAGEFSIGEAVHALRKQTKMTQPEFAKRFGIYPRVLMTVEHDQGNPTVDTLNKLLEPFGFEVGVVRKRKSVVKRK